ncbi:hypothetical protein BC828DRAFT_393289 [Blastocladiella britannica]|nr:hypothetical protein BC828DRAFT_393289 [Blastocladiella britannica]
MISSGSPTQSQAILATADPHCAARWCARLAGRAELRLPFDYPTASDSTYVEADVERDLPDRATRTAVKLAMDLSADLDDNEDHITAIVVVEPFHVLVAAVAVVVARLAGEDDVTLGTAAAAAAAVDTTTNSATPDMVVLRLGIPSDAKFTDLVTRVARAEHDAASDPITFPALLAAIATDTPNGALFPLRVFNAHDTSPALLETVGAAADISVYFSTPASLRRRSIAMRIAYNAARYSATRISDLADQIAAVLAQAESTSMTGISLVTDAMRARLPDPTAPLEWTDAWPGPITRLFAQHARASPENVCVVEETGTESVVSHTWTYGEIYGAAAQVANALRAGGIVQGDVVVLYSARCADLVVGVMGVLMAGATFSVIDPAYPPARQQIYLTVANPRGLVILARAGELHASVRQHITDTLQLKVELPPIHLCGESRVIPTLTDFARTCPDLDLGPDSTATLSFTSGSTGIPKGVRGRHFSLTYFYPWMARTFDLTSTSRFSMLSGIAHDPIQRDIFTPLFLGASVHVPRGSEIGSPGALAAWLARANVSVTHLTPAMAQLVTAGAPGNAVPQLHHAFLVGDLLTKRDVARLQHVAPRCAVVNMYGTTETQRAVSYLRVPSRADVPNALESRKEIVPAGVGMHGVQLVVINKAGGLAGVGEMGEIYVRSAALAEGYLGLDEATAEKFVANPFVAGAQVHGADVGKGEFRDFGLRDRLYRTGDLGRYLPDGAVECVGRADDQVKLRGFRIEVKEIDMYLSQHPRVRENVTLVRRDKDEEQTLVAYLVLTDPEEEQQPAVHNERAVGRLRYAVPNDWPDVHASIRAWLSSKLPTYAVPSVLCPLRSLPLTPNGKVDKVALPFPDTAVLAAAVMAAQDTSSDDNEDSAAMGGGVSVLSRLRDVWAQVLHAPAASFRAADSFFESGGHSVAATRLVLLVRREFGIPDAPLGLVFDSPRLGEMAARVGEMMSFVDACGADATVDAGQDAAAAAVEPITPYAEFARLPDDIRVIPTVIADVGADSLGPQHVLVTGATGFLGAFIVAQLIDRAEALGIADFKVSCLVRAPTTAEGHARVMRNLEAHGCFASLDSTTGDQVDEEEQARARQDQISHRVVAIVGDLAQPQWGLPAGQWQTLARSVDAIVHNGAMVHWVYPYARMSPANVGGTLEALRLSVTNGRAIPTPVHFVSSTSVLDVPAYTVDGNAVAEADSLDRGRDGLRSGYAQSKWVAERLLAQAAARGVPVTCVRPGYIVGHSRSGVTNGDDFLWRLVKGCIELGAAPEIENVVNMCPVDYVAECVVALALTSSPAPLLPVVGHGDGHGGWAPALARGIYGRVYHTYNSEHFKFRDLLARPLADWSLRAISYPDWRAQLLDHTMNGDTSSGAAEQPSALFPLLHFVLDDLPTSTRAPPLATDNTEWMLRRWAARVPGLPHAFATDGVPSMHVGVPRALAYLTAVGFLSAPPIVTAGTNGSTVASSTKAARHQQQQPPSNLVMELPAGIRAMIEHAKASRGVVGAGGRTSAAAASTIAPPSGAVMV